MSRRALMPVAFLVFALAVAGTAAAAHTTSAASGTLVVADRDVANALDPDGPNAVYIPNIDAYVNTYDTLIQLARKPNPLGAGWMIRTAVRPMLATSWKSNASDTAFTFQLRHGVRSSYGHEFTSADVKYACDRAFGLNATGHFVLAALLRLKACTPVGKYVIRFTTTGPSPDFLTSLATAGIQFPPYDSVEVKKHATTSDPWAKNWLADHTAGYGPYTITNWVKGQTETFKALKGYWGGKPPFPTVRVLAVPSVASRLSALQSGDLDLALALTPDGIQKAAKSSKLTVNPFRGNSQVWIFINYKGTQQAFHDFRVRQALAYAIPYQQIISGVYFGRAQIARTPYPLYVPFATGRYWHYDTSVAKAKALLQAAGASGLSIDLYYANERAQMAPIAAILQNAWQAIGVKVNIINGPESTLIGRAIFTKDLPAYVTDTASPVPPTGSIMTAFFTSDSFLNVPNYNNPAWDKLHEAGLNTVAPKARGAIYSTVQRLFEHDLPFIPAVTYFETVVTKKGVGGVVWRPDHSLRFDTIRPGGR
jgi:peptide/nickel transport system substrate-binding protein